MAAAIVMVGHLFVSLVALVAIWIVELVFRELFGGQQPSFWGVFPLKYLFQASEAAAFAVFASWGIVEAHKAMKS